MSIPRIIYLALALAGLLIPWYYNLQFMQESGGAFSITEFMAAAAFLLFRWITQRREDAKKEKQVVKFSEWSPSHYVAGNVCMGRGWLAT